MFQDDIYKEKYLLYDSIPERNRILEDIFFKKKYILYDGSEAPHPNLDRDALHLYLKYKNKYLNLQKEMYGGGPFSIFHGKREKTASYIFTRDHDGTFYFALSRKLPEDSRIRLEHGRNTGAAGTKPEYMGKWGSFGGGVDRKSKNTFEAAINEINDEGHIRGIIGQDFDTVDVEIEWLPTRDASRRPLKLLLADDMSRRDIGLFLFEIKDSSLFFVLFPKISENPDGRSGPLLVESSDGEIDKVGSMSMEEMITQQTRELGRENNNFFLSYFCDSFNKHIKPKIEELSETFSRKWGATELPYMPDIRSRVPHKMVKYQEVSKGKYIQVA